MVRLTTYPNAQDTPYKDTGRGTPAGLAAAGDSIPHDATRLARESGALCPLPGPGRCIPLPDSRLVVAPTTSPAALTGGAAHGTATS
eukprot:scaffold66289_cov75-Phaeocystis_antarctica.AAC.3